MCDPLRSGLTIVKQEQFLEASEDRHQGSQKSAGTSSQSTQESYVTALEYQPPGSQQSAGTSSQRTQESYVTALEYQPQGSQQSAGTSSQSTQESYVTAPEYQSQDSIWLKQEAESSRNEKNRKLDSHEYTNEDGGDTPAGSTNLQAKRQGQECADTPECSSYDTGEAPAGKVEVLDLSLKLFTETLIETDMYKSVLSRVGSLSLKDRKINYEICSVPVRRNNIRSKCCKPADKNQRAYSLLKEVVDARNVDEEKEIWNSILDIKRLKPLCSMHEKEVESALRGVGAPGTDAKGDLLVILAWMMMITVRRAEPPRQAEVLQMLEALLSRNLRPFHLAVRLVVGGSTSASKQATMLPLGNSNDTMIVSLAEMRKKYILSAIFRDTIATDRSTYTPYYNGDRHFDQELAMSDLKARAFTKTQEDFGHVYAFRMLGNSNFIKIGAGNDFKGCLQRWKKHYKRCLEPLWSTDKIKYAKRVESLIFLELWEARRREKSCCKIAHEEWFEVDEEKAKSVVRKWVLRALEDRLHEFGCVADDLTF